MLNFDQIEFGQEEGRIYLKRLFHPEPHSGRSAIFVINDRRKKYS